LFSRYASLVKNLRGVVLLDPSEGEEGVKWLQSRFKYRNLGVPPSILIKAEEFFKGRLGGRPFVELVYPTEALRRLVDLLVEEVGGGLEAVEAYVLASAYVSPILLIGRRVQEEASRLAVDVVESRRKLDLKMWKLHLRIADYTVLDLYRWSTEHVEALLRGEVGLEEFRRERLAKIRRDKARYWRLTKAEGEPWSFLYYLDLASRLSEDGVEEVKKLGAEAPAGLAIEAAVAVSP